MPTFYSRKQVWKSNTIQTRFSKNTFGARERADGQMIPMRTVLNAIFCTLIIADLLSTFEYLTN